MRRLTCALLCSAAWVLPAHAVTLTNGTGDGSVTVDVTEFGSFGSSTAGGNAFYNPIGALGSAGTTFESFVYLPQAGGRAATDELVTSAFIDNVTNEITNVRVTSQTDTSVVTEFSIGLLDINLTQTLAESFDEGVRVGSTLSQIFAIRNTGPNTSFDIVRYLDGDLAFDGSISDAAGIIQVGSNQILFETDAASSGATSDTFLGITSTVSGPNLVAAGQNFEVGRFSGLRRDIEAGATLSNSIEGDGNGDGFTDSTFDITLAQEREVSILSNQTITYTTQTLFGNAVPPSPGQIEAAPLLPDSIGPAGGFNFEVSTANFAEGETIWIDPDIATGYTYTITGADFDSVTAPSFGSVPDADMMFVLSFGGSSVDLASGETFVFTDDGVTEFTITGIDTGLALDPTDTTAFVTGVAFRNPTSFDLLITQTPITEPDGGVSAVPLPASVLVLLSGLFGLGFMRRRTV